MGSRINRFSHFIRSHKRSLLLVGFFVVAIAVGWYVVGSHAALADNTGTAGTVANAPATSPATQSLGVGDLNPFNPDSWLRIISTIMLALARLFLSMALFGLTFVIEVAGYNGYLGSSAVTVGWVMVRDIANMAFVVVLLVIAFATILGVEHYEWKKMLTKFVLMAIVVNFSRTICGVLIDLSQVVMNTFLNGIAATAGGNLINAFHLDKIMDLSRSANPQDITAKGVFAASFASVFFAAVVMALMFLFLYLLVGRMVKLWVIIVLSPLAFAFSILHQTEHYVEEWWHEFGAELMTGPAILFFLWLSFVVIGNGNVHQDIASNNSLPSNEIISTNTENSLDANKILPQNSGVGDAMGWNNMANFFIAAALLYAGAEVAQKIGGFGANIAEQAVEFGKETAMMVSGVEFAKHKGGALLSAAKEKLEEAPEFVFEKTIGAPLERNWDVVKNKVAGAYYDWTGNRIRKVGEHIDTLYGDKSKTAGFWQKMRARAGLLVAPREFKEEWAKDVEESTEAKKEALSHEASTSKTPWGIMKRRAQDRLESLEKTGQKIKARKVSDEELRRDEMLEIAEDNMKSGKVQDREKVRQAMIEKATERGEKLTANEADQFIFDAERRLNARKSEVKSHVQNEAIEEEEKLKSAKYKEEYLKHAHGEEKEGEGVKFEQKAIKAQQEAKLIEDKLAAKKELEVLEAIRELLKEGGWNERSKEAARYKAVAEFENRELQKDRELEGAAAKDHELEERGEMPRFVASVRASHAKEVEDQLNALNFRELTKRAELFSKKLIEEKQKLESLRASGAEEKEIKEQEERVQSVARSQAATLTSNMNRGFENGTNALELAADATGFKEEVAASDFTSQARKLFSGLLAKNYSIADADKIITQAAGESDENFGARKAMAQARQAGEGENAYRQRVSQAVAQQAELDFRSLHGDDYANTLLRNLDGALRKAAGEGASTLAGLFNDRTVNDKGQAVYHVETEADKSKVMRDYYTGNIAAGKLMSLAWIVNNKAGKVSGVDSQGLDQFVTIFRKVTRGTTIDSRLIGEFKDTLQRDASGNPLGKFTDQLGPIMQQLFSKLYSDNASATAALLGKLPPEFAQALGDTFAKLRLEGREVQTVPPRPGSQENTSGPAAPTNTPTSSDDTDIHPGGEDESE